MAPSSASKRRSNAVIDPAEDNHRKQRAKVDHDDDPFAHQSDSNNSNASDNDNTAEEKSSTMPHVSNMQEPTVEDPLNLRNSGLSAEFIIRISGIREYKDTDRGVYYVTHVPDDLKFGKEYSFDMSNFLVRPDNHAVVVWIVGRVVSALFQYEDGVWPEQAYITFTPLVKEDMRSATWLCNHYAMPQQDIELNPFGTLFAGKFLKRYGSDKPPAQFRSAYDATACMKKKKEMKPYNPTKVKQGDIVLAELRVRKRYEAHTSDMEKASRPYKISFQLDALNMLLVGPEKDEDSGVPISF
ncbi:hypothetical protein CALCODRAFT_484097 [Calocera cornea HHB12733]|uniref:Uncharacterized protein n=1 Tax=Calocera cornea HHB12733 TaxID=1353952 RepID=A0A165F6R4_9BASI|nr:hypothetical protein CALCODRAFT_484097 [Calocera cornea HHB12733]